MMALSVEDLGILVLGREECGYYSKSLAFRTQPRKNTLYTLVTDKHDITFGCARKLADAVKTIDAAGKFGALLVITTCVIELTGEDIHSVLAELQEEVSFRIMLVQTDHFTKDTPISGLTDTQTALAALMQAQPVKKRTFNILGYRFNDVAETELSRLLKGTRARMNVLFPGQCSIEDIRKAPRAALNIVTHFASLPLAERMREAFGIPYIHFNRSLDPEDINRDYQMIERILEISIGPQLEKLRRRTRLASGQLEQAAEGKTFVFSSPPMLAFQVSSFLSDREWFPYGFKPQESMNPTGTRSKPYWVTVSIPRYPWAGTRPPWPPSATASGRITTSR